MCCAQKRQGSQDGAAQGRHHRMRRRLWMAMSLWRVESVSGHRDRAARARHIRMVMSSRRVASASSHRDGAVQSHCFIIVAASPGTSANSRDGDRRDRHQLGPLPGRGCLGSPNGAVWRLVIGHSSMGWRAEWRMPWRRNGESRVESRVESGEWWHRKWNGAWTRECAEWMG